MRMQNQNFYIKISPGFSFGRISDAVVDLNTRAPSASEVIPS
jgi:hypothetical protein